MPDSVSFDLKQLIRVCLNDPDLRAELSSALADEPLPVRTPCVHVKDGERTFQAVLKSDRNKAPGEAGFISRDNLGWLSGRLTEVLTTDHDASTISAESMAKKMGVAAEQLPDHLKGSK